MINQRAVAFVAEENRQFAGTGGVSEHNAQARFVPAFQDSRSGQVAISRFRDGWPAPFHIIDGLPDDWITERDLSGRVVKIKSTVISGFVRFGRFFTRQEASDFMELHAS